MEGREPPLRAASVTASGARARRRVEERPCGCGATALGGDSTVGVPRKRAPRPPPPTRVRSPPTLRVSGDSVGPPPDPS